MSLEPETIVRIRAVSRAAALNMTAILCFLRHRLSDPSPAIRGASVCMMCDLARGKLSPLPPRVREEIVEQLSDRLSVELDPFLRELIVRESALLDNDQAWTLTQLAPSEN